MPETDLEVIIRSGGGQKDSRKRIYAKYTEGKSTDEIIAFLKKEYSQVGKGFELHGHPISVWFDENGMTAGYGMQAAESVVTTLSWDQIEKYIHAMITYGLYMDANEAALVDKTEMERVSYQIGYFLRDWIDDVPEELNSIEKIETLLSTHEGREQLESFLEDVDARISYGELKPKTVKSPGYLLSEIADLDRERIHFPLHDTVDVRQEDFITQDEIDYALCIGSGFADGKFRIYEYFMDLHNQKENADFLKKEYGIGGQSGALPGNSSSNSEHDAKGILLEKGSLLNPYTKVLLNWNVVEERICELIYADKYFSPQEKEEYKNYKKEQEKKAKEAEITRLNNGIRLECKQEIEKQIAELRPLLDAAGDKAGVKAFARGGLAMPGWAVVGEEGPELVNFSQPGRVYTAADTAALFRSVTPRAADTDSGSDAEVKALRREVYQLRRDMLISMSEIARFSRRTSDMVEAWDAEGMPGVRA